MAGILWNLFQCGAREKLRMGCKLTLSCMNHFYLIFYTDFTSIYLRHLLPPKASSRLAAPFICGTVRFAYPITLTCTNNIHWAHQFSWTQRMAIHRLCCYYFQCCSCQRRPMDVSCVVFVTNRHDLTKITGSHGEKPTLYLASYS